MVRSAWPFALLVAIAGCLWGGDGGGGDDDGLPGDRPPALAFTAPVQMPGDQVAAEPNVIAADGGRVWVVSPGSVVGSPNVHRGELSLWHSSDGGETYEALRTPADRVEGSPFCSCDTDISLGPDGVLYMTDFWTGPVNGFVVESSADDGRTWEPGNFVTVTNVVGNDRQYINAGDEPGEVYLSYARGGLLGPPLPLAQPDQGLHLWRSDDGGRTFAQRTQVVPASTEWFPLIAKPRVAPDGTVFMGWMEATDGLEGPARVLIAASGDDGATFGAPLLVADVPNGGGGIWPFQFDVGPDGVLHAAWTERGPDGVGSRLWHSASADGGATFSAPVGLAWTNGTAVLPWVAHAGPARAVIAFYGTPAAVAPKEAPEGTEWHAWVTVIEEGVPRPPVQVSPWPVKVGAFCPEGASCPEDRELLDYPGVVWHEGQVHVALSVSILDEGAGPGWAAPAAAMDDGHSTAAHVWMARAPLP